MYFDVFRLVSIHFPLYKHPCVFLSFCSCFIDFVTNSSFHVIVISLSLSLSRFLSLSISLPFLSLSLSLYVCISISLLLLCISLSLSSSHFFISFSSCIFSTSLSLFPFSSSHFSPPFSFPYTLGFNMNTQINQNAGTPKNHQRLGHETPAPILKFIFILVPHH